jgi:hypothetical protein
MKAKYKNNTFFAFSQSFKNTPKALFALLILACFASSIESKRPKRIRIPSICILACHLFLFLSKQTPFIPEVLFLAIDLF